MNVIRKRYFFSFLGLTVISVALWGAYFLITNTAAWLIALFIQSVDRFLYASGFLLVATLYLVHHLMCRK